MTTPATQSNSSLRRLAKPIGLLALTGIIVGYSLSNHGVVGMPEPSTPHLATVVEAAVDVEPQGVSQRFASLASRASNRPGIRDVAVADRASALALLHKNMGNGAAQTLKRDQVVAELESSFRSEAVDAAWSAQSEDRIVSATSTPVMASAGFKAQDVAMDCRSTTCRISARFGNAIDAHSWADRLLTQMGATIYQARVAVLPQGDGSYEVRVYGARKKA